MVQLFSSLSPLHRRYLWGILISGVGLSLLGFVLAAQPANQPHESSSMPPQIDQLSIDQGCDVGSGFIWCVPKNKCLRLYEEKCEGVVAASASAQPSPTQSPLPETSPTSK